MGKIQLANFTGLTAMPQKAASAWTDAMEGLVGASYKPLLYGGEQVVRGTNYWFIAEKTTSTLVPTRKIVKFAINEFRGEYRLLGNTIEVVLG